MRRAACIRVGLATMFTLAVVVTLTAFVGTTYTDETTTTNHRQERQSDFDPNIFGVASVAGVTSRNGRVSTTGGIHFFPNPEGIITSSDGHFNPITFTKAINGKYATGSINIQPGALGVSSTAQAGYNPNNWLENQWPQNKQWPMQNNQWPGRNGQFQIQNNQWPLQGSQWTLQENQWPALNPYLEQRNPWYNKVTLEPQRDVRRFYPSFNPFLNFWR